MYNCSLIASLVVHNHGRVQMLEMLVLVMSSKHGLSVHIISSHISLVHYLIFKAHAVSGKDSDAPCVVLVVERKVTDWVQAEVLKLIIVVGAMMIVITMESLVAMVTLMCCSSM